MTASAAESAAAVNLAAATSTFIALAYEFTTKLSDERPYAAGPEMHSPFDPVRP